MFKLPPSTEICPLCKGSRFSRGSRCGRCEGVGYVESKEPSPVDPEEVTDEVLKAFFSSLKKSLTDA